MAEADEWTSSSPEQVVAWVKRVVLYGLREPSVAEHLHKLEGLEARAASNQHTTDDLCDGVLLAAFAMTADPSTASSRPGIAVTARLAFFVRYCKGLGVEANYLFKAADVWPTPPRNPKKLLDCLEACAQLQYLLNEAKLPSLWADEAPEAAVPSASSSAKPKASGEHPRALELSSNRQSQRAAAQKKKVEAEAAAKKRAEEDSAARKRAEEAAAAKKKAESQSAAKKRVEEEPAVRRKVEETTAKSGADVKEPEVRRKGAQEAVSGQLEEAASYMYVTPRTTEFLDIPLEEDLPGLQGHLLKRSPNMLNLRSFQRRFVVLKHFCIYWWRSIDEVGDLSNSGTCEIANFRGRLDLGAQDVEVTIDPNEAGVFYVKPKQQWAPNASSDNDLLRTYIFSADGSEHSRRKWIEDIQVHIDRCRCARQQR
mmetsp:Transcript_24004/g.55409  ORF Transcript_24004/g.55409 Transcript_24004/m.55409 type:complete len:426 (-) Transcript_24004:125-1402(-)